jgi:hypothetical protein
VGALADKACIPEKIIFLNAELHRCIHYLFLTIEVNIPFREKSLYCICRYKILLCRNPEMKSHQDTEEIRWQVMKAMLDDFPSLKKRAKNYVEKDED